MVYTPLPPRVPPDERWDTLMPGPGIGDPGPEEHAIIGRSTFGDRLVCRCGIIALADHERRAWIGPEGHTLAFGGQPVSFGPALAEEPSEPSDEPVASPARRTAAEVMAALGITDD